VRPDPSTWSLHLEATLPLLLLAVAYGLAARRFAAARWRVACFAAGIAMLAAAAVTPLDALTYHLLTAHLLQNVVLAEWAPALLVLGVPPALARELARPRAVRVATHPAVALPVWLGTYFAWHLPVAYDAALRNPLLLHTEHVSYLVAGVLLWWSVLQDAPHALAPARRAACVFAAFILASPIGLLLALLPDAVYEFYADGTDAWDVSPLTDQQIAGVTMAGEQAIVFFAAFAYFFLRFFAEEERAGEAI
jgi:cytochrome c oxidase assembly factor CtaG